MAEQRAPHAAGTRVLEPGDLVVLAALLVGDAAEEWTAQRIAEVTSDVVAHTRQQLARLQRAGLVVAESEENQHSPYRYTVPSDKIALARELIAQALDESTQGREGGHGSSPRELYMPDMCEP